MTEIDQFVIDPMSARAFELAAGHVVRIVDVAGGQPGDLVAFAAGDVAVRQSQARTRVETGRIALGRGDSLWSNELPPRVMLTIADDTGGPHDLLYPPCCRFALEKRFGVSRDGCFEHLASALAPWGIVPAQLPEPLNLFFQVAVDAAGRMTIRPPCSPLGSLVELRAELDCLVAVSSCSVPFPGREPSGYRVTILAESGGQ